MAETFDLVVLGTGTAGTGVARRCGAAGWSVAIVDELPYGGTCALRGCDPKKVLVGAAEALDWVRRMEGKGLVGGSAAIRWSEFQRFKRTFTDPVPEDVEARLTKAGVRTLHGRARFTGRTTVQVGEQVLNARHVVIATGAMPAPQAYPGAEHLMTSDRFLELDQLPRRIVFVGGGYVSFEFAHVAARAGTQVTILHRGSRPLERFDADLVALLLERTRALGIDVQLRTEVRGVARSGAGFTVHSMSEGVRREFEADLVVHGAGRMPALASLDLDRAGVAWDQRGVKVNEFLQSVTSPAVYAAGDAAGSGPPLTPVAGVDAKVVAANLLDGNHQTPNYSGVASVVFTIPPLASVGLTEAAAGAQEGKFRVRHERTSDWYTAKRVAEEAYGYKTLVEEGTERILGAHLLGPHAEEVINLFALAVRKGLTTTDLKEVVRPAAPRRRRGRGRLSLRHRLPRLGYRVVEAGAALRSRLWRLPYGDQGLFVRREVYGMIGGFPPLPLMEDVAFVRRLSRVGTLVFPPVRALTSARRWERHGILATTVRNWWLLALYAFGRPPDQLARLYDEHPT